MLLAHVPLAQCPLTPDGQLVISPPRASYNPINLDHSWPYWVAEAVRLKEFSLSYSFSWMTLLYPFQIKDKILQPSR